MPKVAIIGRRGSWSSEALSGALNALDAGGEILELDELGFDLSTNTIIHPDCDLNHFDHFIIKKMGREQNSQISDQLALLEMLEQQGLQFFSAPTKLRKMISRLSCTATLQAHGLPLPPTYIGGNAQDAINWVSNNGTSILKPLYSTKARGMFLLTDLAVAKEKIEVHFKNGEKLIYLQKKLTLHGSDHGIVFIGGQYVGAFSRIGDSGSWHTSGADVTKYAPFTPSMDMLKIAEKAQSIFDLDFITVDLAHSDEMGTVIFEVSAFGGYGGLHKSANINAAELMALFVTRSSAA